MLIIDIIIIITVILLFITLSDGDFISDTNTLMARPLP